MTERAVHPAAQITVLPQETQKIAGRVATSPAGVDMLSRIATDSTKPA
jgi:hypothetical protein